MKRYLIVIFVLAVIASGQVLAQSVSGVVRDSMSMEPLPGAFVMLMDSTGVVLEYAGSDSEGRFTVSTVKAGLKSYIEISLMGYGKRRIDSPFERNYAILLHEEALSLETLVVKARKVQLRGDTIEYSVPAYVSSDDRNLGDILKKLPGMDVTKDGRVEYQGKEIGKLYIEGRDILGSRYNIATQNIDPRDLSTIDIYENHQPIKALEGTVESNIASINIRLKDGAKGKWTGALQGEAGYSTEAPHVPYSASALGMFIGRNYQSINTAKTDAAGNNIIYESDPNVFIVGKDETEFLDRYRPASYLSMSHTLAPIDQDRTRFNTSYSVTTNHTVPVGENMVVSAAGKFEHNALESASSVEQTYTEADGSALQFTDATDVNSTSYYVSGDASFELNSRKVYLKDKFRFDMRSVAALSSVGGTRQRSQNVWDKDMNMLNYFSFIKNTGNWVYSFDMLSQYSESGEQMRIVSPEDRDTASQNIDSRVFYNILKFNNTVKLGKIIRLHFYSSIPYLYRTFRTNTEGVSLSDPRFADRLGNDVMLQYIKPNENIRFELKTGHLRVDAGAELWYQYLNYRLSGPGDDHKWAINPDLLVKYDFGARFSAEIYGRFSMTSVDEQNIYDGLIMQSHRYMTLGRTELTQNPTWTVRGNVDFRDPISGWYLLAGAAYSASSSFQYTRYFIDDYVVSYRSDEVTDYSIVSASATVSKAINGISGKIDLTGGFAMSGSDILQQDITVPYTSYTYSAGLKFIGDLARWMKVDYNGTYALSRYQVAGEPNGEDSHSLNQRLTLSFYPYRSVSFDLSVEHYLDKYSTDNMAQICMFDASLFWFATPKFQLFLHAKNLLDNREYSYTVLSPLNITKYAYRLRPMNVLIGFEVKF